MNAAVLPFNSATSELVTSDHAPSVVGETRTFHVPSPSKNPGMAKPIPSGPFTVAEKCAMNGLAGWAWAVKVKSCGCQRGTERMDLLPLAEVDESFRQRPAYQDGALTEAPDPSLYQEPQEDQDHHADNDHQNPS